MNFNIAGRAIGPEQPMYVIAEMSANHGHDLEVAKEMIRAAAKAGADAVKLQTYTPDTMTIDAETPWFRIGPGSPWEGRHLYELYGEAYTPWEWHGELMDEARRLGVHCFSSPFDKTAIDFLEDLDVPAFKIASFELIDLDLIAHAAATGKPLILSTGLATAEEIDDAVLTARANGCDQLAILRCNSAYPADPTEMDLRTIPDMRERWQAHVGLSDHTLGPEAALAACTLGANILEKHFKLDETSSGADKDFSMTIDDFANMIHSIRTTEAMLGGVRYGPTKHELASLNFRRSLFAVQEISEGELFRNDNIRSIRPGNGLPPKHLHDIVGAKAKCRIARGTPISWSQVDTTNSSKTTGAGK